MFSTAWVSFDGARGRWSSKRKRTVDLADALFTMRAFGVFVVPAVSVGFAVGFTFGKSIPLPAFLTVSWS